MILSCAYVLAVTASTGAMPRFSWNTDGQHTDDEFGNDLPYPWSWDAPGTHQVCVSGWEVCMSDDSYYHEQTILK